MDKKELRIVGLNILLLMKIQGRNISDLFCSIDEFYKVCNGISYIDMDDVRTYALYFNVDVNYLLILHDKKEYLDNGIRGYYLVERNNQVVLDIFDMYSDVKEIVNKYGEN